MFHHFFLTPSHVYICQIYFQLVAYTSLVMLAVSITCFILSTFPKLQDDDVFDKIQSMETKLWIFYIPSRWPNSFMCCASYLACSGFSVVYSPKLEEFLPFMLLGICLGVISKFLWPEGVPNHFDHFITERCIYSVCIIKKKLKFILFWTY